MEKLVFCDPCHLALIFLKDRQLLIRGVFGWFHITVTESLFLIPLLPLCNLSKNYVLGVCKGIMHITIGYIYVYIYGVTVQKNMKNHIFSL